MSTLNKKVIILFLSTLLLFGLLANLKTKAYITDIEVSGKTIEIDITKMPIHTEFVNFENNLTDTLNTVIISTTSLALSSSTDALVISQPDVVYTTQEMIDIWDFLATGNKTLFIGGDSDYGGFYLPTYANALLESLGSKIRFDATSINDIVYNDGASYRVAAVNYSNGIIGNYIRQNCLAGIIMHGPCSIVGYESSNVVDLRNNTIEGVEVLLSYSENATAFDSDISDTDYDLYSRDNQTLFEHGNYPAVVCEELELGGNKSFIVLSGEMIFSDYQKMYDQYTSYGTYNGGIHYGQMFVDNLINFFLADVIPIYIHEYSTYFAFTLLAILPFAAIITMIFKKKKNGLRYL